MRTRKSWSFGSVLLLAPVVAFFAVTQVGRAAGAPAPTIQTIMTDYRPRFGDVEYDLVDPKQYGQCKISVIMVKEGKEDLPRGWLVTGPAGQTLRRFMDTDGNDAVDQFSYYRDGLEVYRDIDSNRNNRIDQARWMNLGGTRWGIDSNEDGKIDAWKVISPDEVSRIAVKALVTKDATLLAPLLVTKDDLKALGIKGPLEAKLLAAVADPAAKLAKNVTGSKNIHAKTTFRQFDSDPPSVIPKETYSTAADLYVYENAMAIVDTGNPQQLGMVNVGELVRIGDVWKLTIIPHPLEGNNVLAPGAIMFQVVGGAAGDVAGAGGPVESPKIQELVEKLKKLMDNPPAAGATKVVVEKYYKDVENVLIDLVNESKSEEGKIQWTRQLVDTLAAAAQSGNYPAGVAHLQDLEKTIAKASPKSPLVAVARFRWMLAEYALAMDVARVSGKDEAMQKVHGKWLEDLEEFLEQFPTAEDAPDAALQLAVALEFGGKLDRAKKWYQRIAGSYRDSPAAAKAAGALNRLDLVGKSIVLSGAALTGGLSIDIKQFRGKVVLVVFWDTTNKPFADEMPQIKALYDEYRAKGFEVVGVNLDMSKDVVAPWLLQKQVKWPQIHEPGGLESAPARTFGIVSLPTMFLVDASGKVTNHGASVADVKNLLAETYVKK